MKISSQKEAQTRVDQVRHFQSELKRLEEEGVLLLNRVQKDALSLHHRNLLDHLSNQFDIDTTTRGKQLSLGMRIASFLGALGLGASVFFLFYQFWGRFTTAQQVGILAVTPLLTLLATFYAALRERTGYFTKLLALVTLTAFVLNLSMLGQIFNILPSTRAFLVWAIFAFLLAYATDARLLLAAGIFFLGAFLSAEMGTWSGCYWISFGERPENFFPATIVLFLIPDLISHKRYPGYGVIYRVFAMVILFIVLLILSNWGAISYLPWNNNLIEGIYQTAGFLLTAGAIAYGIRKNRSEVVNTGNVFFVLFLYTKFYDWWWDWMPKYLFFLVVGLSSILALLIFKRLRGITEGDMREVAL